MDTILQENVGQTEEQKLLLSKKAKQKRLKKIVTTLLGLSIFFFLTTVYSQYQVYVLHKLAAAYDLAHPDVPVTPNQIVEAVAHHMILPDTVPQIAEVQDAKKLSTTQDFFKDAVNGDVVLVYETTIIVYRPTQDIIVAVGNVSGAQK